MATDPATVWFVGPNGPVDVPLARASNVQYGDSIHVPDEQVRAGLLIQEGTWSATPPADAAPVEEPAVKAKPKTDPASTADTPKE